MTDWYASNDERLNYRDIELSRKLRTVGYCTDIDNLFCDFVNLRPVAFSEYKHGNIIDIKSAMKTGSQQVIRYVAERCGVPSFVHIYCPGSSPDDPWVYNVIPNNDLAKKALDSDKPVIMSEQAFHDFHSRLRHLSERRSFPTKDDWCHPELRQHIAHNYHAA